MYLKKSPVLRFQPCHQPQIEFLEKGMSVAKIFGLSDIGGSNIDESNIGGSDMDESDIGGSEIDESDINGSDMDGSDNLFFRQIL